MKTIGVLGGVRRPKLHSAPVRPLVLGAVLSQMAGPPGDAGSRDEEGKGVPGPFSSVWSCAAGRVSAEGPHVACCRRSQPSSLPFL